MTDRDDDNLSNHLASGRRDEVAGMIRRFGRDTFSIDAASLFWLQSGEAGWSSGWKFPTH